MLRPRALIDFDNFPKFVEGAYREGEAQLGLRTTAAGFGAGHLRDRTQFERRWRHGRRFFGAEAYWLGAASLRYLLQ